MVVAEGCLRSVVRTMRTSPSITLVIDRLRLAQTTSHTPDQRVTSGGNSQVLAEGPGLVREGQAAETVGRPGHHCLQSAFSDCEQRSALLCIHRRRYAHIQNDQRLKTIKPLEENTGESSTMLD